MRKKASIVTADSSLGGLDGTCDRDEASHDNMSSRLQPWVLIRQTA